MSSTCPKKNSVCKKKASCTESKKKGDKAVIRFHNKRSSSFGMPKDLVKSKGDADMQLNACSNPPPPKKKKNTNKRRNRQEREILNATKKKEKKIGEQSQTCLNTKFHDDQGKKFAGQ